MKTLHRLRRLAEAPVFVLRAVQEIACSSDVLARELEATWVRLLALYDASQQTMAVPPQERADFASVPVDRVETVLQHGAARSPATGNPNLDDLPLGELFDLQEEMRERKEREALVAQRGM